MVICEGKTDFLFEFESSTGSKEHDVGRLEGIVKWKGDATVVEAVGILSVWRASDSEVP